VIITSTDESYPNTQNDLFSVNINNTSVLEERGRYVSKAVIFPCTKVCTFRDKQSEKRPKTSILFPFMMTTLVSSGAVKLHVTAW
jgi:hypothetical protein